MRKLDTTGGRAAHGHRQGTMKTSAGVKEGESVRRKPEGKSSKKMSCARGVAAELNLSADLLHRQR